MTQFVDNEKLSQNTLLEIDMAEMTQSHLTGADLSCGQSFSQSTSTSRLINQSIIQNTCT